MEYGRYDVTLGSGAYLSRPSTYKPQNVSSSTFTKFQFRRKNEIINYLFVAKIMADCGNNTRPQIFIISGPVLKEIFTICKEMVISSYVLQQGYPETLSAVYLTNSVKPLGLNNGEFFMRFQTDMNTKTVSDYTGIEEPTFFTDTGIGVEKRIHVSRLPYEGNQYPSVNYAFIQDTYSGRRFTVLTDRAHGFTSTRSGQLETIFDRRLPYDDARGMDEGVNDPEDMVSNYVLLLEPLSRHSGQIEDSNFWKPSLAVQRASKILNHQPSLFVYDSVKTSGGSNNVPHRHQYMVSPRISLFSKAFPADVFLLNLRTPSGNSRGAPAKKALMILQNLGHSKSVTDGVASLNILDSDLKLDHFATSSDLVGDTDKEIRRYQTDQILMKVGILPKGKAFELKSYMVHFY